MGIGIVGSGKICATAARIFAEAGHEVTVSNSRGPESLASLVEEVGPRARDRPGGSGLRRGGAGGDLPARQGVQHDVLRKAAHGGASVGARGRAARALRRGRRRGGEGRRLAAHRGDGVRAGGHRLAEGRPQARAGLAYPQGADGPGTTSTRDARRYSLMQHAVGPVNSTLTWTLRGSPRKDRSGEGGVAA